MVGRPKWPANGGGLRPISQQCCAAIGRRPSPSYEQEGRPRRTRRKHVLMEPPRHSRQKLSLRPHSQHPTPRDGQPQLLLRRVRPHVDQELPLKISPRDLPRDFGRFRPLSDGTDIAKGSRREVQPPQPRHPERQGRRTKRRVRGRCTPPVGDCRPLPNPPPSQRLTAAPAAPPPCAPARAATRRTMTKKGKKRRGKKGMRVLLLLLLLLLLLRSSGRARIPWMSGDNPRRPSTSRNPGWPRSTAPYGWRVARCDVLSDNRTRGSRPSPLQ
mmetsp:Transcript_15414/g.33375  ORF Transcript_15414/g.33375 Transcript_15414/m.33375 type:complete len:271 (+) Transcript_15414:465-1277(+)